MEQPLISVIIPVYNMEPYISRCLDSVLNNTYRNLEVICVDDGSRDDSLKILRKYESADSRIIVIPKENGGVSSARNAGMDRMTGEYAAFIDPDDLVHPQYFEVLLYAAQQTGAGMTCCRYRVVEERDLPIEHKPVDTALSDIQTLTAEPFFKNHELRSYCWGRLFNSELLSEVRFRDLNYSEDSIFTAEVWEHNRTMTAAVLPYALYCYYQRDTSLAKVAKQQDHYKAAEIHAAKALESEENDVIFLDQAVKRCLSARYYVSHIFPDKKTAEKCNGLLKACRKRLKATTIYSKKEKLRYSSFISLPGLYWLYRIINEPDMWNWEKYERKKRKKARRKKKQNSAT